MKPTVFFLHSAGTQETPKDGSNPFLKALEKQLPEFQIIHPKMPDADQPSYDKWAAQLRIDFSKIAGPVVLVAHSLGGSILLKILSESSFKLDVKGIFLVATPFWGAPDWEIESFELKKDFHKSLPKYTPVHFYHGDQDEMVDPSHLNLYAHRVPGSYVHLVEGEGHLFENGLMQLAKAIESCVNWPEEKLQKMETFSFGDSPALADELLALVLAGTKTATCGALRDYKIANAPTIPKVGRQDIVLDGSGRKACIIETTHVEIKRFKDVDHDFAISEGEGPYEVWKSVHEDYFARNGGFDPDMELVCERFKLIHIFPHA